MAKMTGTDVVVESTGDTDIAVASQATVYTHSIHVGYGEYFKLTYKATSATGTPDVKIEMEVGDVVPTTEGSADTTNYSVPENMSPIESNLITETLHSKALNPPVSKYIRFKITGNADNPSDTILNMTITKQEE